jgi:hypothetical protein
MSDDLPELLYRDRTITGRLRRYFEYRTIAEMSVWFCIAAVASLIVTILGSVALGPCGPGAFILWLVFLGWLWRTFARIARGWNAARLGTRTFKYMQITFLAAMTLTMLVHGALFEQRKVLALMLLSFDVVVVAMAFVFLLLARSARCRVPWRTYGEVCAMAALLVAEVLLTKYWDR